MTLLSTASPARSTRSTVSLVLHKRTDIQPCLLTKTACAPIATMSQQPGIPPQQPGRGDGERQRAESGRDTLITRSQNYTHLTNAAKTRLDEISTRCTELGIDEEAVVDQWFDAFDRLYGTRYSDWDPPKKARLTALLTALKKNLQSTTDKIKAIQALVCGFALKQFRAALSADLWAVETFSSVLGPRIRQYLRDERLTLTATPATKILTHARNRKPKGRTYKG